MYWYQKKSNQKTTLESHLQYNTLLFSLQENVIEIENKQFSISYSHWSNQNKCGSPEDQKSQAQPPHPLQAISIKTW